MCALSQLNWWVVFCLNLIAFFIAFAMLGSNVSLVLDCILASLGMLGTMPSLCWNVFWLIIIENCANNHVCFVINQLVGCVLLEFDVVFIVFATFGMVETIVWHVRDHVALVLEYVCLLHLARWGEASLSEACLRRAFLCEGKSPCARPASLCEEKLPCVRRACVRKQFAVGGEVSLCDVCLCGKKRFILRGGCEIRASCGVVHA